MIKSYATLSIDKRSPGERKENTLIKTSEIKKKNNKEEDFARFHCINRNQINIYLGNFHIYFYPYSLSEIMQIK